MRRVIVHESIADDLVRRIADVYGRLTVGNPNDDDTLVGPLINARAFEAMQASIAEAVSDGGTLVVGGDRQEIGDPAGAADYVKRKRANREAVTGFGHRVYRAEDPRARHMRAGVERLSEQMGQPQWYRILAALVDAMKPYARHGVNVNVDFYAGVVYFLNGIPEDLFVPIFAIGTKRSSGMPFRK